ncbi:MAG: adenylosuccinate lyase [Firmicutes bacterium]|nr:adenylosuccinate lyase [Dethiobacter sp.]MBS3888963.1 adenylosuccinate lyase [Bacillota bacterium]MBS4054369.1 adenylosuccinate lyase [Thermaerobacter sp.]
MIERYSLPAMRNIWTLETKYQQWLAIEILACEAWSELGVIPRPDVELIRQNARFDPSRIAEIELETNHDVVAFTRNVSESLGPEAKWVHYGLTSTDVVDTALSLQLVKAMDLVENKLTELAEAVAKQAKRHKHTVMMGRTHGVHAEPTTFGLKLAVWYAELRRHSERLSAARQTIAVGKLSGAVGTYANINPYVEEYVCSCLGLTTALAATQTLQRDRHASLVTTLAIVGCSLEKFATEIRALQKTEVQEVEEPFARGQKGSSAMPHKRNPIMCERVAGLSRVLRGYALTAMENVALWHERDISHSSAERIILPDAFHVLYYMLHVLTRVMEGLTVNQETMQDNMARSYDLVYSQHVLLQLIDAGLSRESAYDCVQNLAGQAWVSKKSFKELVLSSAEIRARLDGEKLHAAFDLNYHLKYVDYIFARVGLDG